MFFTWTMQSYFLVYFQSLVYSVWNALFLEIFPICDLTCLTFYFSFLIRARLNSWGHSFCSQFPAFLPSSPSSALATHISAILSQFLKHPCLARHQQGAGTFSLPNVTRSAPNHGAGWIGWIGSAVNPIPGPQMKPWYAAPMPERCYALPDALRICVRILS